MSEVFCCLCLHIMSANCRIHALKKCSGKRSIELAALDKLVLPWLMRWYLYTGSHFKQHLNPQEELCFAH